MFNAPSFFGFRSGGYIPQVSDPDAQAFVNRVFAAGGSVSNLEANAVNTLVIQMKSDLIWTKMKVIYPMVGGGNLNLAAAQSACEQNLVSASFTGAFTSGWTFASTGVTPNGTSAYMDTALIPNSYLSLNSQHLSFYSRSNVASNNGCQMGAVHSSTTSRTQLVVKYSGDINFNSINFLPSNVSASYNTDAFFLVSQTNSTTNKSYRNSTLEITRNTSTTQNVDRSIYISARNDGSAILFDNRQCAFASIGDGLTDTEASDLYTAVQAFQTTLSRQV